MKTTRPKTRVQRLRDHMEAHPDATFSMRELRDAIEPQCPITTYAGTISNAVRCGILDCIGKGVGRARYRKAAAPPSAPPAPTPPAPRKPPPPSDALRQSITGIAKSRKPVLRMKRNTNYTAAPGTVDNTYCPKRLASRELAADIAAFEARGGRIEKLGVTLVFHRADADVD